MNPDGIYPDDTWYQTEAQDGAYYERLNRTRELLEYADVVLLAKVEQDGDPPDGIVVEVIS